MKAVIIGVVIGVAIAFVRIAVQMTLFHRDTYEKDFVCPSCGARFRPKWYQMILKRNTVYMYNGAYLKCPICREKGMCNVVYDQR